MRLIHCNTLKFQDKLTSVQTGQKFGLRHLLFWRYASFPKLMSPWIAWIVHWFSANTAISKNAVERKAKSLSQDRKVMWYFYNDLRPLKYVPKNSMDRLSVSESISKRWATLKTVVVGGPSNRREFKQMQWRQKRPWTTIGLN